MKGKDECSLCIVKPNGAITLASEAVGLIGAEAGDAGLQLEEEPLEGSPSPGGQQSLRVAHQPRVQELSSAQLVRPPQLFVHLIPTVVSSNSL